MRISDEQLAEIRQKCPTARVLEFDGFDLVVEPFDEATFDRYFNDVVAAPQDAGPNLLTRHVRWPPLAALRELRRALPLLDGDVTDELCELAGKPPAGHDVATDSLTESTPPAVLERAGLSEEAAAGILEQARAQGRRAVIVYAERGEDEEPIAGVVCPPLGDSHFAPIRSSDPAAKKTRSQAIRSAVIASVVWVRGGTAPAEYLRRHPAAALYVFWDIVRELGGQGALRARKSSRRTTR